jgi:hypothetical protein
LWDFLRDVGYWILMGYGISQCYLLILHLWSRHVKKKFFKVHVSGMRGFWDFIAGCGILDFNGIWDFPVSSSGRHLWSRHVKEKLYGKWDVHLKLAYGIGMMIIAFHDGISRQFFRKRVWEIPVSSLGGCG